MKYALIDNAVVQCDDISNHILLNSSRLFEEKKYCLYSEYKPVFDAIAKFLILDEGNCELFVSTHFYFIPCFIKELQHFLGKEIHIIPINQTANEMSMVESYECYSIKTMCDNSFWKCTISKNDAKERARQVIEKMPITKEIDISSITKINDYIDHLEVQLSIEDFCELVIGDNTYKKIVVGEDGCLNFSPFGSLRYYDELTPRVHGFDFFHATTSTHVPKVEYNYVMSTLFGDIPFKNRYQTWINTEKGGSFLLKCMHNNEVTQRALTIPDCLIEENEICIKDMRFGKFYVDMECDFLGNLHLSIESLSGKTFYQILPFAL